MNRKVKTIEKKQNRNFRTAEYNKINQWMTQLFSSIFDTTKRKLVNWALGLKNIFRLKPRNTDKRI